MSIAEKIFLDNAKNIDREMSDIKCFEEYADDIKNNVNECEESYENETSEFTFEDGSILYQWNGVISLSKI